MEIKFTINDLIRFGTYLLSEERKKTIPKKYQKQVDENEVIEYIRHFHNFNDEFINITQN